MKKTKFNYSYFFFFFIVLIPFLGFSQDVQKLLDEGPRKERDNKEYSKAFSSYDGIINQMLKETKSELRDQVIEEIRLEKHSVAYQLALQMIIKKTTKLYDVTNFDLINALKYYTKKDGVIPSAQTIKFEKLGDNVTVTGTRLTVEQLQELKDEQLPADYKELSVLMGKEITSGRITYFKSESTSRAAYDKLVLDAGKLLKKGQVFCVELFELTDKNGGFYSPFEIVMGFTDESFTVLWDKHKVIQDVGDSGGDGFGIYNLEKFRSNNKLLERKIIGLN